MSTDVPRIVRTRQVLGSASTRHVSDDMIRYMEKDVRMAIADRIADMEVKTRIDPKTDCMFFEMEVYVLTRDELDALCARRVAELAKTEMLYRHTSMHDVPLI